jgi:hypothetical protein
MMNMQWWQYLVGRATDNELEQAVSALGAEEMLVQHQHMYKVALAELGKRSRVMEASLRVEGPKISIIWTSHGHYAPDGEPTEAELAVRPRMVARCGGPGMCPQCSSEAART